MRASGSCLCKAVEFSFELKNKHFDACHCSMCRKWSGGPGLGVEAADEITFIKDEGLAIYASSEWAERGFCNKCGSSLFYRLRNSEKHFCNISLGVIDNHEDFEFTKQVYIDSKPGNYSFSNETENMTEEDVMVAFGGGS